MVLKLSEFCWYQHFFCKKLPFFGKNSTFVYRYVSVYLYDNASGIRFPDSSKSAKNHKNDNDVPIFWHGVIVFFFFFFDVVLFVLSGLVTGPSFMSISSLVLELWQFYFIGIDQKSENRNTSTWVLSNIWRLGLVRVPNLVRMSIIKFYWMLQNASCSFCRFWVIKGKPIVCVSGSRGGRGNLPPPPPPRFRLKRVILYFKVCWIQ